MTNSAVLRGYLLEEALAWLLRNTGYRLLVHKSQDPNELVMNGDTLFVQGRGTTHQADVLGEFALTPAFSLPALGVGRVVRGEHGLGRGVEVARCWCAAPM
jgi:hypothetical protein